MERPWRVKMSIPSGRVPKTDHIPKCSLTVAWAMTQNHTDGLIKAMTCHLCLMTKPPYLHRLLESSSLTLFFPFKSFATFCTSPLFIWVVAAVQNLSAHLSQVLGWRKMEEDDNELGQCFLQCFAILKRGYREKNEHTYESTLSLSLYCEKYCLDFFCEE